jgi:hypothetical protein
LKVILFKASDAERWDAFIPETAQGVFLHTRRFISYHRDRFCDMSLLFEDDNGRLRAVLPAARSLEDPALVISHPGITFGGLLHDPRCTPGEIQDYFAATVDHFRAAGLKRLLCRMVPTHVQRAPVALDQHAIWLFSGKLVRRDLWNVLDLTRERIISNGHKRHFTHAKKSGVICVRGKSDHYASFHSILSDNLKKKYGVAPVHSAAELLAIQELFPCDIDLWIASRQHGEILAGVWVFHHTASVWHTQYIASTDKGQHLSATHLLLETITSEALRCGIRCLSFGASTENSGLAVNAGLFEFKSRFGAGSTVHDFYNIDLEHDPQK